jgi:hypothetical protein
MAYLPAGHQRKGQIELGTTQFPHQLLDGMLRRGNLKEANEVEAVRWSTRHRGHDRERRRMLGLGCYWSRISERHRNREAAGRHSGVHAND